MRAEMPNPSARPGTTAAANQPLPTSISMTPNANSLPALRSALVAPALPLPVVRMSRCFSLPSHRLPMTLPAR